MFLSKKEYLLVTIVVHEGWQQRQYHCEGQQIQQKSHKHYHQGGRDATWCWSKAAAIFACVVVVAPSFALHTHCSCLQANIQVSS